MQFFFNSCGEEQNETTFANEFYLPNINTNTIGNFEPSCSSGRLSKTVHKLHYYEIPPTDYQYLQSGYGGIKLTKYCPISEFDNINPQNMYIGRCSESLTSTNPDLELKLGEKFTSTSFCALSSLISKEIDNYQSYSELRAVCYEMYCSTEL